MAAATDSKFQIEEPTRRGTRSTSVKIFEDYIQPCVAEFLAVTMFVFVSVMSGAYSQGVTVTALGTGFAILIGIASFGAISGGHLNPAVTLGVLLAGGMKPILAPFYVLAQLLGGVIGAASVRVVLPADVYDAIKGGITLGTDHDELESWMAMYAEILMTSMLVMTVLFTAVDARCKVPWAAAAIGLAVAAGIVGGGYVSGGSLNPARSFGPALISGIWTDHWVYWVGPLLGGALAALIFRVFLGSPEQRIILK